MNTGAFVGAIIEILIFTFVSISFLYLHFKPESEQAKSLRRLPVTRVVFKYKYSFLVVSLLGFVKVIIDILNLLVRLQK